MSISKDQLRKMLRETRASLTNQSQCEAAAQLNSHIHELDGYTEATNIALYWPHDSEIDCIPAINDALKEKKHCYLPVLWLKNRQTLAFAAYTSKTPMIKNRYGILEPDLSYAMLIDPSDLDIIFVPLVGFDLKCWRLGRGGGFYDAAFADLQRTHSKKRPKLVGLAYDCQLVTKVPVDSWDWRLDSVITEKKIYLRT